jgi:hypothetical protein
MKKQDKDFTQWVLNNVALNTCMTDDIAKEAKINKKILRQNLRLKQIMLKENQVLKHLTRPR